MSRARHYDTPTAILRRIVEGRGMERCGNFKSWTETKDVPSRGRSHRLISAKIDDLGHHHSDLERDCCFIGEWLKEVRKIRPQWAMLPLGKTMAIAKELEVTHPVHPETGFPWVMTTDQIWTIDEDNGASYELGLNVKYVAERETRGNKEKRQIEDVFHADDGRLVVDFDEFVVPDDFVVNWGFVRVLLKPSYADAVREELAAAVDRRFRDQVRDQAPRQRELAHMIATAMRVSPRDALCVLHHLIAHRIWPIDIFNGRLGPSLHYRFLEE